MFFRGCLPPIFRIPLQIPEITNRKDPGQHNAKSSKAKIRKKMKSAPWKKTTRWSTFAISREWMPINSKTTMLPKKDIKVTVKAVPRFRPPRLSI
jgi:hypothetical protein